MTDARTTPLPFLADLEARGLLHQKTAELTDSVLETQRPPLYVGFDPSAPSLHAGNLMPLLGMDRYRQRGGQIIVLLGGATGMIARFRTRRPYRPISRASAPRWNRCSRAPKARRRSS
jgi:tyrosyl-tRNA synthetase